MAALLRGPSKRFGYPGYFEWQARLNREREDGILRMSWVHAFQEAVAFEREVWSVQRKTLWKVAQSIPEKEKAELRERVFAAEKNRTLNQYKAQLCHLKRAHELLKYQLTKG